MTAENFDIGFAGQIVLVHGDESFDTLFINLLVIDFDSEIVDEFVGVLIVEVVILHGNLKASSIGFQGVGGDSESDFIGTFGLTSFHAFEIDGLDLSPVQNCFPISDNGRCLGSDGDVEGIGGVCDCPSSKSGSRQ